MKIPNLKMCSREIIIVEDFGAFTVKCTFSICF